MLAGGIKHGLLLVAFQAADQGSCSRLRFEPATGIMYVYECAYVPYFLYFNPYRFSSEYSITCVQAYSVQLYFAVSIIVYSTAVPSSLRDLPRPKKFVLLCLFR